MLYRLLPRCFVVSGDVTSWQSHQKAHAPLLLLCFCSVYFAVLYSILEYRACRLLWGFRCFLVKRHLLHLYIWYCTWYTRAPAAASVRVQQWMLLNSSCISSVLDSTSLLFVPSLLRTTYSGRPACCPCQLPEQIMGYQYDISSSIRVVFFIGRVIRSNRNIPSTH